MAVEGLDGLRAHADEVARELVRVAAGNGLTVSTAESCTAGMVASLIADVPGASAVLRGGAVTYCDEVKHKVLGVDLGTLERYTAVSAQTASEMAAGSRRLFASDAAVSLTGYAGPGGGTVDDPAGTVYIGIDGAAGAHVERCAFTGDRNEVRLRAAVRALELLVDACGACGRAAR